MTSRDDLPEYEPLLASYHAAFALELRSIVAGLGIEPGDKVLEMACGDGAYGGWLAEQVGPEGLVLAVDIAPAYLRVARTAATRTSRAGRIGHVEAPVERLPFRSGTFDLVWCAQSLYSLADQEGAVRTMADLLAPGGRLAILEDDAIHQLLLPWPADLELAIRTAEYTAFAESAEGADRRYVGRRLPSLFRTVGLRSVTLRSFASGRVAPLGAAERVFLLSYFDRLRSRVEPRLAPGDRDRFLALIADSDDGLVNAPDIAFTCLDLVVTGLKA